MKIILNGKDYNTQSQTISEILKELKLEEKVMATAVNLEVVKKENWNDFKLKEDDKLELLNFVGGG